jgi:hypothetical protein
MRVKDLPTTTAGSTSDFLIKDNAAGTATEKITIANLSLLLSPSTVNATWTDYSSTSTIVGWSNPTKILNYVILGKLMFVQFSITGTSDSTSTSFTLPITANGTQAMSYAVVRDNSSFQTYPGYASIANGAAVVNIYKDGLGTGWTASNDKRTIGSFFIMIN